jgi:hypothetical protein
VPAVASTGAVTRTPSRARPRAHALARTPSRARPECREKVGRFAIAAERLLCCGLHRLGVVVVPLRRRDVIVPLRRCRCATSVRRVVVVPLCEISLRRAGGPAHCGADRAEGEERTRHFDHQGAAGESRPRAVHAGAACRSTHCARQASAQPCHICTGTGPTPATSAPGTGLSPATSAPGLGSPRPNLHRGPGSPRPHLHRGLGSQAHDAWLCVPDAAAAALHAAVAVACPRCTLRCVKVLLGEAAEDLEASYARQSELERECDASGELHRQVGVHANVPLCVHARTCACIGVCVCARAWLHTCEFACARAHTWAHVCVCESYLRANATPPGALRSQPIRSRSRSSPSA